MTPTGTGNRPILHQLLAVKERYKGQATKVWNDTRALLTTKQHHFGETHSEFIPSVEGLARETLDAKSLQTTLTKELNWSTEHLVKAIDISYQVDVANVEAKATIELDGKILVKDVPATTLLGLEAYLAKVIDMIQIIPTLDPAKGFVPDPDHREPGVYKARELKRTKTLKRREVIILAPATDKHPQQQSLEVVDSPVGQIVEQEWSSLITPAKKSELFERAEEMLRAVKDARARANTVPVNTQDLKIGATLLDYIFQPIQSA
jgi:hypothetical protein